MKYLIIQEIYRNKKFEVYVFFLIKLLIIKTLHISIYTSHNIKDDTHNDDEPGTRDKEIYISWTCSLKQTKRHTYLCHQIWKYRNKSKESSTKEIESIRSFLKICCCFFSWTNTWDVPASFLDILCYFSGIERNRNIEEGESKNKEEIECNIYPSRIVHWKIIHEPTSYFCTLSSSSSHNLTNQCRKRNEWDSKDNWNHTSLIDTNRKMRTFISTCSCIDKRNFSISFCKSNDDIDNPYSKECKEK